MLHQRRSLLIFGTFFGAWLGFIYAFVTQAINWIFLSDIPLAAPGNSLPAYVVQLTLVGAVLGLVTSLPENRLAGTALGGLAAALLMTVVAVSSAVTPEMMSLTLITTLLLFLPLMVLMMPLAFVIRMGVDAQEPDPSRPHLWARRYLVPVLLTMLVVLLASFSLHDSEVRRAFRSTQQLVQAGLRAGSEEELPASLLDTKGFLDSADGSYSLSWTDRVDTFFGPRPAGAELSQFLIITRFSNGYAIACLYSNNRSVPTCTNHR